jgi:hypothetical protein
MTKFENNIRAVFDRATPAEITNGVYWYDNAGKVAEEIAETFQIPQNTVCLVISALSPNNNWTRNIADAWKVCRTWHKVRNWSESGQLSAYIDCVTCTYPANKQKAFDILDGKLTDLNGLKTKNFARNLAGCEESVTVDVHAFSIAQNKRHTAKTMKPISKKVYEEIATAYQNVARHIGIAPAHLQAVVWQTWRRLHGLTTHQELTGRLF